MTYFNAEHGLSVRHPARWTGEQSEREGVWYRYFQSPAQPDAPAGALSATLLAGPLAAAVDDYAAGYLAGQRLLERRPAERPGAAGARWLFTDPAGSETQLLVLLREAPGPRLPEARVVGLHLRGPSPLFARQRARLEELAESLAVERPEHYREVREASFGLALRLPPSWKELRHFSGRSQMLLQFQSPALAAERDGQALSAVLSLSAESQPAGTSLVSFHAAARARLGDAQQVQSHQRWGAGLVDSVRSETSVSSSRARRYYALGASFGYVLSCEAREDVFYRVAGWCDLIAGTLVVDGQPVVPAAPAAPSPADSSAGPVAGARP